MTSTPTKTAIAPYCAHRSWPVIKLPGKSPDPLEEPDPARNYQQAAKDQEQHAHRDGLGQARIQANDLLLWVVRVQVTQQPGAERVRAAVRWNAKELARVLELLQRGA